MQTIMTGLTSVPGVMGGILSDEHGNVLAHSLPPFIEQNAIKSVADLLQEGAIGLQEATGGSKLLDIRFEQGRLVVKALPHMFMTVLCQPAANVQLLFISLNIAIKKLEKMAANHQFPQHLHPSAQQSPHSFAQTHQPMTAFPAYSDYRALSDSKGVLLKCEILKKTASTFWDSMSDSISINRNTAVEISSFFNTGPFKKLTISNRTSGVSKHVPVHVIQNDRDRSYDGRIIVTLALAEQLRIADGEQVRAEVVIGGGILGWEGI